MSSYSESNPAVAVARGPAVAVVPDRARARRRAMRVTAVVTIASLAMLAYLLLRGHTVGEQVWGPITAAAGAITGTLSLAFLTVRGRGRAAKVALAAAWLTVAFLGFGGYQSHRLALPAGGEGNREGPPIAPLMFIGFGIAGTASVRSGSKGQ